MLNAPLAATAASRAPFSEGSELPKRVRLVEQPDGALSKDYEVTLGHDYEVLGRMGSCLVTTSDVPGETVSIYYGRFRVVN